MCIVSVYMCTVLLPPGGYPIAVNKYIYIYIYIYTYFFLGGGAFNRIFGQLVGPCACSDETAGSVKYGEFIN